MSKVGVFDSGIGGQSVANALSAALPADEVLFINDKQNMPYGLRSHDELKQLAIPHLRELEDAGCDVIVVACNTLSTTIIPELHQDFSVPIIPVVPMVKPACTITKTRTVAVCATPTTLASKRYAELKSEFGTGITFIEPYCGDWASMIETNTVDRDKIETIVNNVCDAGADVIVLGCTHYHWIEELLYEFAQNRAVIIQPEQAIIMHVLQVLGRNP